MSALLVASACTHDFSIFDTSKRAAAGDAASGGAPAERDSGVPGGGGGSAMGNGGAPGTGDGGGDGGARGAGGVGVGGGPGAGGVGAGGLGVGGSAGAGGVDAGGPSAGGAAAGDAGDGGPGACTSKYGAVPGFTLCTETATTCRFAASPPGGGTCNALCAGRGGVCLDQDDNGTVACVATNLSDDCNTSRGSAICVCTR